MSRRFLARGAPGWPEDLEHLASPPGGLWLEGVTRLAGGGAAVVGARRATAAGLAIAREVAAAAVELGMTVNSGFAMGIDAAAHAGALDAGGETVAVLGCGLDVDYPQANRSLRERIRGRGLLVTEHAAEEPAYPSHFPERNRIIAALSMVVVVVEATERSGALSTARWAADLGCEILAVPGSIRAEQHRGTNLLIRDGVRPYLGPGDLADVVGRLPAPPPAVAARLAELRLPPELRELLRRLGGDPVHPDEVGALLGLGPAETAARISALEIAGEVRSLPGGLILRCHGPSSSGLE